MVRFRHKSETQLLQDLFHLLPLLQPDQNVRISHAAKLRLGVPGLHVYPFQGQVIDAICIESIENAPNLRHLSLADQQALAVPPEKGLHHRLFLGDAAADRALIDQSIHMVLFHLGPGFFQIKFLRQGADLPGDGTFQEGDDALLCLRHDFLRNPLLECVEKPQNQPVQLFLIHIKFVKFLPQDVPALGAHHLHDGVVAVPVDHAVQGIQGHIRYQI